MRKLLNMVASTTIFSTATYLYLKHHTQKNNKQYNQILQAGTTKDASRLSNQSFGISWGFQADDIVMSKIDSGDYLFIKYQCFQCLSVPQYINCFTQTMWKLDEQFDSIGYAYRNAQGLWILFNQFGQTKVKSYAQLVSLPYLKGLTIQKTSNTNKQINLHKKMKQILQKQQGKVNNYVTKQTAVQMVNRINRYFYGNLIQYVTDIRQLMETSKQILVRTQTNRTLRSL